jgi:hypothetical protein
VRRFHLVLVVFLLVLVPTIGRPVSAAQVEGHAEISRPAAGDTVSGVVTILGSASSPNFDHFELSFGYDPNPTDTWFSIGDVVSTQVSFGRLGLWDSTRISDGTYMLRLIVTLDDGSVIQDVVEGIDVRGFGSGRPAPGSGTPGTSETLPVGGSIIGATTPTAGAAQTAEPPSPISEASGRGIDVPGVILAGAATVVVGLLGLAAYVEIRQSMRRRWSSIRTRRSLTGSRADDRQEDDRP